MTPEQRVAEAMSARLARSTDLWTGGQYRPALSADTSSVEIATTAALDAVRAALTSDDPAVMRAMAERVGLRVDTDHAIPLSCGHFAGAKIKRIRVSGPWREVPDAEA